MKYIKIYFIYLLLFNFADNLYSQSKLLNQPVDLGSKLELFVDSYMIDEFKGDSKLVLNHPIPREIVMYHDQPWEVGSSAYHSIFKDGEKYKMYYKAKPIDGDTIYCAYAESYDGIHWVKPNLGLYKFENSSDNNIVLIPGEIDGFFNLDALEPTVFKDENPLVPKEEQYKALFPSNPSSRRDLLALKSANGFHWHLMPNNPVLGIGVGTFDSQNIAFWDAVKKEYRAYWRYWDEETRAKKYQGYRSIRTAVSTNFIDWKDVKEVKYFNSPREHLYTNQIQPYYRAPHLYIGFPTRYVDRGWSVSMEYLPDPEARKLRSEKKPKYGTALSEALFMASRDGETFYRWNEAFIRQGIERTGSWVYGNNYTAWQLVETKSDLTGAPNELSFYIPEDAWNINKKGSALRRHTLRIDGFVSLSAPMTGGGAVTKPFVFSGSALRLNFSSSIAGEVLVELLDKNNKPIPGFSFEDCDIIFGDSLERIVSWHGNTDVSLLAGKVIKIHFKLKDADIYSFQFK